MIAAAIYARKSTEQLGICDEEKSISRQIEHARAYGFAPVSWTGWLRLDYEGVT
jgi:hypothetical protein